jgi:Zn-dependent peptidase ImmA (M78 family)
MLISQMPEPIAYNKQILTWAVNRAGYQLEDFAEKNPNIKVLDWISSAKEPTLRQLEKFAQKTYMPFGYLFLPTPPAENLQFPFFRTGHASTRKVNVNVFDTIAIIQRRQQWLREYLDDVEIDALPFVGKFSINNTVSEIVADIRMTLDLDAEWACKHATWEKALDFLSAKVEEVGIYLAFNGIVENNTHRAINVNDCRGFVLVDQIAPYMFINAADSKAAQMFTLGHELAHVWIGQSAGFDMQELQPASDPLELLCDKIAAELLVPEASFLNAWQKNQDIQTLSRFFKVSRMVIARRALDLGKISKATFRNLYQSFMAQAQHVKDKSSGGNFYATQRKRLGLRYLNAVENALKQQKIFYRDAAKLTGLKSDTYQKVIKEIFHN